MAEILANQFGENWRWVGYALAALVQVVLLLALVLVAVAVFTWLERKSFRPHAGPARPHARGRAASAGCSRWPTA